MNVIALASRHQHSNPKIIILQQIKILIRTNRLDGGFLIHHTGVIKRITLLCKLYDFCIRLRQHSPRINGVRISGKLLHDAGANAHFRMCVKHSNLFFTAIRVRNVITVHPGNQFIFAMLDAFIECVAKSTVLREADNIQRFTHLLLLCSNHAI